MRTVLIAQTVPAKSGSLGALDKAGMGLNELNACTDALRTVAEVPETASMDAPTETMQAMLEAMRSAADPLIQPAWWAGAWRCSWTERVLQKAAVCVRNCVHASACNRSQPAVTGG